MLASRAAEEAVSYTFVQWLSFGKHWSTPALSWG